jgi:hypothetical protein
LESFLSELNADEANRRHLTASERRTLIWFGKLLI